MKRWDILETGEAVNHHVDNENVFHTLPVVKKGDTAVVVMLSKFRIGYEINKDVLKTAGEMTFRFKTLNYGSNFSTSRMPVFKYDDKQKAAWELHAEFLARKRDVTRTENARRQVAEATALLERRLKERNAVYNNV